MDTPNEKTDAELMGELPDVVRDIIQKSNWQTQLRKIVTQRHYRVDQGAFLEEAVFRFIVGEESAEELAAAAMEELKLDANSLRDLLAQLDREIFAPMKVQLEQALDEEGETEQLPQDGQPAPAASPSPYSAAPVAPSIDEDDLQAMLNADDAILPAQPKPAPTPAQPAKPATPAAAPVTSAIPAPAAPTTPVVDPMAAAREKLAAPVTRPAEVSSPTPTKPAPAPTPSADPYREPLA